MNSPNITINVDTNRAPNTGNGAGGVFVTVSTITIAELSLPEYSSGTNRRITLAAEPGFQFDPASNITAQSATIGFNGGGINAVAAVTPAGTANESITFELTSGTNTSVQDIIRVNGVRIRILSAEGAAGPARTTMTLTTSTAGGAFTDQGIVAANITRGQADRLVFTTQPGDVQAGQNLLPAVSMVDFGGNIVNNDARTITLAILSNPGAATLLGTALLATNNGVATWTGGQGLNITTAGVGYTLRASHNGDDFLTNDTIESQPFNVSSGPAGTLEITTQPADTAAGAAILISVTARDEFGNPSTSPVDVTLDAAVNPAGWPLLADSSLTKSTVNGVASWEAADRLRINSAIADYRLAASGAGPTIFTDLFDITPAAASALRFVQQPTAVLAEEGVDPAPTVEIIDAFGNRTGSTASVQLTIAGADCGGAVTGGAVAAIAGLATFNALTFDTPCPNLILAAASAGLIGTSSDPFNVQEGPPIATRLAFSRQPTDTEQSENLLVDVTVLDQFDRPFTAATLTIELGLAIGPAGAELLADSSFSKQTVNGVASWVAADRLRIDVPGSGFQLSAGGVGPDITSDAFDIIAAANGNDDGGNNGDDVADPAGCGACGAGAGFAFMPLLLAGSLLRRPMKRLAR